MTMRNISMLPVILRYFNNFEDRALFLKQNKEKDSILFLILHLIRVAPLPYGIT